MELVKSEISFFNSITKTEVVKKPYTLGQCLDDIREGTYRELIEKVRGGRDDLKRSLPAIAVHGVFKDFREKKDFILSSGIIIIDIDDISKEDDIEEIKEDIAESFDYVFSVMISPSGNGVKVLCYVDPDLVTADNYREIGKFLSKDFQGYGEKVDWLSITDCLIMTWDPNIIIKEEVIPANVYLKETPIHTVELEPLDEGKELWDDVEEFYMTVLSENIEQKSSNNFHYLQMAMLDLAKYGYRHPKEDLSFIVDYAEAVHKKSNDNKNRFLELVEISKKYPQTHWPYKTTKFTSLYEEEEPEFDYSEYITKPKETESNEDLEEDEDEGMVNYESFAERVYRVAIEGDRVGAEISLKSFADIFRFRGSGILTVTGIPGMGKTEFIDQCILDLARLYNQKTLIAGFEQSPEEHVLKLVKKMIGKDVTCKSYIKDKENIKEINRVTNYITSKIRHIDTVKQGSDIINLLKISARQIQKSRENGEIGVRYVVIDPYNMLSVKGSRLQGFEKVEDILRKITIFSHQMDVMVILVAHPVKIKKDEKTKMYEVPDFYSVKGSSAFFEMSYHGLVVHREGYLSSDRVLVRVLKVKQASLGKTMEEVYLGYEKQCGRYIPLDEDGNEEGGDHRVKDWLNLVNPDFLT